MQYGLVDRPGIALAGDRPSRQTIRRETGAAPDVSRVSEAEGPLASRVGCNDLAVLTKPRHMELRRKATHLGASADWGRDPDAFEVFYREHVDAVERFISRRVSDRELVADLTADVFVAAIEAAESYSPSQGAPAAWLYGIARNLVASRARRDGRERRATARVRGREALHPDDIARIDQRLAAEQQSRRLYAAMKRLPASERAVLELVALDDLSVGEAAQALDIRSVAARVRYHRARRRMADELAQSDAARPTAARSWKSKEMT
jgi:RNA polymerase sigma-70 factor (ECF subfamily)